MVGTPDRRAGRLEEEEILFDDRSGEGDTEDERSMRYQDGAFRMVDGVKTFDPRLVDRDDHAIVDALTHNLAETSYEELTYTGNQVTDIVVWETVGKTKKIRETSLTYTGNKVTTEVNKQYDGAGVLTQTVTSTYTYTGNKLTSVSHVES